MKNKTKSGILVLVLLLAVGFAAVSTSLVINGIIGFNTNEEEFNVYFSNALVDGIQDLSVIENNQTITFKTELKELNETYTLDYDVTNGSKNYDAKLVMNCTGGNDYLTVTNEFDIATNLEATKTRSGKLTVELSKAYTGDGEEVTVTCTIDANAVERDTLSTDEPVQDLESQYYVGKVITIGTEKFNMISETEDTVTMLAQYNLGRNFKQTKATVFSEYGVSFSEMNGWEYTPGPKEIDIQAYEGNAKTYINEYVSYLQTELSDTTISGNLITLEELKSLGCTVSLDYLYSSDESTRTCGESKYAHWLINGQYYWTRSALAHDGSNVWNMNTNNLLGYSLYDLNASYGIRPVITISKSTLENYYEIGEKIVINNETFNVMSQNADTVTMLAKYNLGTNYRQSKEENYISFSNLNNWNLGEDVDIQQYDGEVKKYVNEYLSYLKNVTNDSTLVGNVPTLSDLEKLGCFISSADDDADTCVSSQNATWLLNGQYWWTRTADPRDSGYLWRMSKNGRLYDYNSSTVYGNVGIRPTITISKTALETINES